MVSTYQLSSWRNHSKNESLAKGREGYSGEMGLPFACDSIGQAMETVIWGVSGARGTKDAGAEEVMSAEVPWGFWLSSRVLQERLNHGEKDSSLMGLPTERMCNREEYRLYYASQEASLPPLRCRVLLSWAACRCRWWAGGAACSWDVCKCWEGCTTLGPLVSGPISISITPATKAEDVLRGRTLWGFKAISSHWKAGNVNVVMAPENKSIGIPACANYVCLLAALQR